jgi:hypothetical protein
MSNAFISRRHAILGSSALGVARGANPPLPTCYCRRVRGGAEAMPPSHQAWKSATPVRYDRDWNGGARHPEQATTVLPLWNERFLYLLFDCRYQSLHMAEPPNLATDQPIYERDCAEFFAAPDAGQLRNYREFEFAPNGEWFDARIHNPGGRIQVDVEWNTGMKVLAAIEKEKKRWWASVAIPIDQIAVPKAGDRWRVNFYRIEGPPEHEPRTYMAWSPTMTPQPNFHVPERFGWMEFAR